MKKVVLFWTLLVALIWLVSCWADNDWSEVKKTNIVIDWGDDLEVESNISTDTTDVEIVDEMPTVEFGQGEEIVNEEIIEGIIEPLLDEVLDDNKVVDENAIMDAKARILNNENIVDSKMTEDEMTEDQEIEDSEQWIYTEYSQDLVANAEGKIVLFFHATWCPACNAFKKQVLTENIPADITLLEVDYDSSTDLKKKYGITAQTSFVQIDNQGTEIKKWVWGRGIDSIIEKTQ